jgi:hypothetical protein
VALEQQTPELLKGEAIVRVIKSQGTRWRRHVERMEGNGMPKRMMMM